MGAVLSPYYHLFIYHTVAAAAVATMVVMMMMMMINAGGSRQSSAKLRAVDDAGDAPYQMSTMQQQSGIGIILEKSM